MAGYRFEQFRGIRPRISKRLLQPMEAVTAHNLKLGSEDLEPWKQAVFDQELVPAGGVNSVYPYTFEGERVWLAWAGDVDVVRSPVAEDALGRIYYTGDGAPKLTYGGILTDDGDPTVRPLPFDWRFLGVPAPAAAPTVVAPGEGGRVITAFSSPSIAAEIRYDPVINPHLFPVRNPGVCAPTTTWQLLTGTGVVGFTLSMPPGRRLRVTSVVDANTVTVEEANGGHFVARSALGVRVIRAADSPCTEYSDSIDGVNQDPELIFGMPNDLEVTITDHGLTVGTVIRVVNAVSQPRINFAGNADLFQRDTWPAPVVHNTETLGAFTGVEVTYRHEGQRLFRDAAGTGAFTFTGEVAFEVEGADLDREVLLRDISYVYTYVTSLGEEGPPSPPSLPRTAEDGAAVGLSVFSAPPTTGYDITTIRVYRLNLSDQGSAYQFAQTVAVSALPTSITDDKVDFALGEVLPSESWDPPPAELQGLVSLPNGVLAGFVDRTVYLSEPYFPHAWPYKLPVEHEIVGLGVFGATLLITTNAQPFVASGSHPRNMVPERIEVNFANTSKRSITNIGDVVLYSCPDGLVAAGTGGFSLVTKQLVTKREWADFSPDTIEGFNLGTRYVGKYLAQPPTPPPAPGPFEYVIGDYFSDPETITPAGYPVSRAPLRFDFGGVRNIEVSSPAGTTPADQTSMLLQEPDISGGDAVISRADGGPIEILSIDLTHFNGEGYNMTGLRLTMLDEFGTTLGFITTAVDVPAEGTFQEYTFTPGDFGEWSADVVAVTIRATEDGEFQMLDVADLFVRSITIVDTVASPTPPEEARFFVYDPTDELIGFTTGDFMAAGAALPVVTGYVVPEEDQLYLCDGTDLYEWDEGAPMEFEWHSGTIRLPYPANMGALRVVADGAGTELSLFIEDNPWVTVLPADDEVVRLPSGARSSNWQLSVKATHRVRTIAIAETVIELLQE